MKKLTILIRTILYSFKAIGRFLYGFTPKGREQKIYENALENIKENDVPRRLLKWEIDHFLNNNKGIRMLSPGAKERLVMNKFGKQLKKHNLKLDPFSKKLIHA